ncbi:MAG: hypothetical protein NDP13_06640 [Crenarchaeota archaeon]|nr:hypothetical protein [Thermoproteota archaeon]
MSVATNVANKDLIFDGLKYGAVIAQSLLLKHELAQTSIREVRFSSRAIFRGLEKHDDK